MQCRLLTRAQWEAVKDIEDSTSRFAYDLGHEWFFSKQVIAPHFAGREYRVCWYPGPLPRGVYGPPEYRFLVFDVSTKLVVGWAYDLICALEDARKAANLLGADVLAEMLDAQRLAIEAKAAREATEVIAKARCINIEHCELMTYRKLAKQLGAQGVMSGPVRSAKIAAVKRAGKQAKVSQEAVRAIRASDEPVAVLAERYGVAAATISKYRLGQCRREFTANPWQGLAV